MFFKTDAVYTPFSIWSAMQDRKWLILENWPAPELLPEQFLRGQP
jgi:hypothetical protein